MAMQTHNGSCHCGAVRYSVEIDLDAPAITCNCSMCGRSGAILQFVTPDKFTLEKGQDNLTDYQFNKHVIHHVFCRVCGIKSFARGVARDGSATAAINTRCLDDIDLARLNVTPFDGKSR